MERDRGLEGGGWWSVSCRHASPDPRPSKLIEMVLAKFWGKKKGKCILYIFKIAE